VEILSQELLERARKNEQTILRGLASVGQSVVAQGLDIHESTVSKMKQGELRKIATLLSLCGFKVVPAGHLCGDPDLVHAYSQIVKKAMEVDGGLSLIWDKN